MDFEKMQSTMQFLLQQQAKHDVIISQHQDRMNELHQSLRILTELAQNYDERLDSSDQRTDSLADELRLQSESFHAHLNAQREDFYARLDASIAAAEVKREADSRAFKELLAKAERNREAANAALDARLDRLASIIERPTSDSQHPQSG